MSTDGQASTVRRSHANRPPSTARVRTGRAASAARAQAMDDGSGAGNADGMRVLSYLLAGPLAYGALGWVLDHFLTTSFLLPTGAIVGMALSIVMIVRRYGAASAAPESVPGTTDVREERR